MRQKKSKHQNKINSVIKATSILLYVNQQLSIQQIKSFFFLLKKKNTVYPLWNCIIYIYIIQANVPLPWVLHSSTSSSVRSRTFMLSDGMWKSLVAGSFISQATHTHTHTPHSTCQLSCVLPCVWYSSKGWNFLSALLSQMKMKDETEANILLAEPAFNPLLWTVAVC